MHTTRRGKTHFSHDFPHNFTHAIPAASFQRGFRFLYEMKKHMHISDLENKIREREEIAGSRAGSAEPAQEDCCMSRMKMLRQ